MAIESPLSELQRRLKSERLIAEISAALIALDAENHAQSLNALVRELGEGIEAERAFLLRFSPEASQPHSAFEWHAPGLPPFTPPAAPRRIEIIPQWLQTLREGREISITDSSALPDGTGAERELRELGLRALLAVPLGPTGNMQGLLGIGYSNKPAHWSPDDLRLLKAVAGLTTAALAHYDELSALRRDHALLRETEHIAGLGSWEWDMATGRLFWSAEIYRILGLDPAGFQPRLESALAHLHAGDRAHTLALLRGVLTSRRPATIETRLLRTDGAVRHATIKAKPLYNSNGNPRKLAGTLHDVTDVIHIRRAMERANRSLRTIRACNAALLRAQSEEQLLTTICRTLINEGGYRLAWVMLSTVSANGSPQAMPAASAGDIDDAFFKAMSRRWHEGVPTPFLTALRTRHMVHVDDFAHSTLPAREEWTSRELNSCIAFPLMGNGRVRGVLEIYASAEHAFDLQERRLLGELADDLGYGLIDLEARRERDEALRALEASEQSLRAALERETDGVIVMDHRARVLFANPAALSMLGRSFEELQGQPFAYPALTTEVAEIQLVRPDGSLVTAEMRSAETEWFKIPALVIDMHDVTQQRRAEQQLRIWGTVLERSGELIYVTDASRRIIAVNRAFEEATGYNAHEAIGRDPHFLSSAMEDKAFYVEMWRTLEEIGHWQGEIRDRRKNGEILPLWLAITAARDEHGVIQHYIAIGSDISERKAAEERIRYLAYHDVLTGLANRSLFKDRIGLAIARAARGGDQAAVLFVDLDRFKYINDSLGHDAGDELLKAVGDRIIDCVRRDDTVSRQGGDEFLILLSELAQPDDAAQVATKIIHEIGQPFVIAGNDVHITPSIGIAVYPEDGEDPDTLVRNADAAMYYAKEKGRNNFQFFFADINYRVTARLALENALRRGLSQGEFEVYYQPQLNLRTNHVIGAEALLRWHRQGVVVEPAEFINVAEDTGLIVPIGEWVVREVCRQSQLWRRAGLPALRIAVNLSAIQFRQKGALDRLLSIMTASNSPTGSLEIELTEGVLMQEAEFSLHALKALKDAGVGLAIDDFGTGYSSLSYLRRFPIDRLKVDKSFVSDLPTDAADRAVTEAIIALAKTLKLAVIAEGVENEEELRLLEERDCEEVQGFYVSPPLPAKDFAKWWRNHLAKQ